MEDIAKLEKILEIKFKDQKLITQAVVHRSYLNEHPNFELDHNERLEFLGDAVLELVVTDFLYKNYPNPEGELTNWRASLVNSTSLADVAQKVGFEPFLYLSKGETKDTNTKGRQYILANTVEAIIGAIYLDQGISKAKKFIDKYICSKLEDILANKLYIDSKSYFQEVAQEKMGETPIYKEVSAVGPDHEKIFTIGVYLNKELIATGKGSSKQEAQTEAAQNALNKKNWEIK
jgi:ribonuclease III